MTLQFPDVSEYTSVSFAGAPQVLARATISTITDTLWQTNVQRALAGPIPLYGYSFLNSSNLGVSPEDQARYAFRVVGTRPMMLDHEPNRGQCATLGEACRWIDTFRSLGGVCRFHYLPPWTWSNPAGTNGLGRPSLQPLADRKMVLVSSYYTAYSDTGPGWNPYYAGCPVPVIQWQWTSSYNFNGVLVDWNAYKGTVTDYASAMTGTPGGAQMNVVIGYPFDNPNEKWIGDGVWRRRLFTSADYTNAANIMVMMGQTDWQAKSMSDINQLGRDVATLDANLATSDQVVQVLTKLNQITPASVDVQQLAQLLVPLLPPTLTTSQVVDAVKQAEREGTG